MTDKLIAIVGPTATGKTALGVRLAHTLGGEIVSADSRQVYRHMDIGTAKPTAEERALVRHQLIDVVDPDEPFGLGQYLDLAGAALAEVWSRGAPAFLVGGSGQYVWAILEGWQVPRVPPDEELRRRLEERASRDGAEALHDELAELEPEAAARIDPRNVRRVVRALEVRYRTGRSLSACRARTPPACDVLIIGLDCPRAELHRRIDARVDAMVEAGLVAEVEGLLAHGYDCGLPAMSGIGYRQVCQHLAGDMTLEEAVAKIKTETHRLARMQGNWFRHDDPRIRWLSAGNRAYEGALRLAKDFVPAPAPRSR
jgi:tRNA dimethylallyltransferase